MLTGWRSILCILKSNQKTATTSVSKSDAILGKFSPIRSLAGNCAQRLSIEELSLQAQIQPPQVRIIFLDLTQTGDSLPERQLSGQLE